MEKSGPLKSRYSYELIDSNRINNFSINIHWRTCYIIKLIQKEEKKKDAISLITNVKCKREGGEGIRVNC